MPSLGAMARSGQSSTDRPDLVDLTGVGPIRVTVDRADLAPEGVREVEVVGRRGRLVVVSDSYASKPQGLSRCRAGRERYLRILDAEARAERYAKLIYSCLHDIESDNPPMSWSSDGMTMTINMISEPVSSVRLTDLDQPA